jgi:hypothetical protein
MTLAPSLKDRVLEAIRRHPAPPRPAQPWPSSLPAALAALAMAGVYLAWGGPSNAWGRPAAVGAWMVAGMAALALTVTWLALPSRRSMLPPPASRLLAIAVGVPLVVGVWLLAWHSTYEDPFVRFGYRCFALTLAAAPWPFAALLAAGPRLVPDRPWLVGGALGAVSGAWAAIVVELWCPLADRGHVVVGHLLPILVLVVAGALLGGRLLRLRRV